MKKHQVWFTSTSNYFIEEEEKPQEEKKENAPRKKKEKKERVTIDYHNVAQELHDLDWYVRDYTAQQELRHKLYRDVCIGPWTPQFLFAVIVGSFNHHKPWEWHKALVSRVEEEPHLHAS